MVKNSANGPEDCLLTEMLQVLPMETVCEIAHRFEERFRVRMSCPKHGQLRSSSVVANMLAEEGDPMSGRSWVWKPRVV